MHPTLFPYRPCTQLVVPALGQRLRRWPNAETTSPRNTLVHLALEQYISPVTRSTEWTAKNLREIRRHKAGETPRRWFSVQGVVWARVGLDLCALPWRHPRCEDLRHGWLVRCRGALRCPLGMVELCSSVDPSNRVIPSNRTAARSNRWDLTDLLNVKIVSVLRTGTGWARYRESSWPSLSFYKRNNTSIWICGAYIFWAFRPNE